MLYNPEIPLQDREILMHLHWYAYTGMLGNHRSQCKTKHTQNLEKQKLIGQEDEQITRLTLGR